jgi:hypothetical protein
MIIASLGEDEVVRRLAGTGEAKSKGEEVRQRTERVSFDSLDAAQLLAITQRAWRATLASKLALA